MVSTVASQQEGSVFESRSFRGLSVWSLHVLPMFAWVSSGCSGFPHHQKHVLGSPVSALDQGTGSDLELVPGRCDWLPTAPLRDGLNAENEFRYMYVYVTIKYLYLTLKVRS